MKFGIRVGGAHQAKYKRRRCGAPAEELADQMGQSVDIVHRSRAAGARCVVPGCACVEQVH